MFFHNCVQPHFQMLVGTCQLRVLNNFFIASEINNWASKTNLFVKVFVT